MGQSVGEIGLAERADGVVLTEDVAESRELHGVNQNQTTAR